MSSMTVRMRDRFYDNDILPYRIFERRVVELLQPGKAVFFKAGSSRTVPV